MRIFQLLSAFNFIDQVAFTSELIAETERQSGPPLVVFLYHAFIIIVLFSALIFFTERGEYTVNEEYPYGANSRITSDSSSISLGIYYMIITCNTVGYGDLVPTSTGGNA